MRKFNIILNHYPRESICSRFSHERTYYFCGNKTVDELCILFNSILRHAHVPEMFNVGEVISVFKGKAKIKVIVKIIEL